MIVEALHILQPFEVDHHQATGMYTHMHRDFVTKNDLRNNENFMVVKSRFDDIHCRFSIERARQNQGHSWT